VPRFLFALALVPLAAWAHDPGLSSATVDFSSREILVQASFAPADLGALKSPTYADLATRSVELRANNLALRPTSVETREVGPSDVEFTLRFPRPAGAADLRSPLLASMPFGHRQAVTIRDVAGALVRTELLSADHDTVSLPGPALESINPPQLSQLATVAAISAFALLAIWLARRRLVRQLA
jgi:hypothetical protein